jgi:F420-dependent oxidoreductase-like protein
MKLGLHIVDFTWPGGPAAMRSTLSEIVQTGEEAGFDAIAVDDHVWQSPYIGGPEKEKLEGYTTLAFIAALTNRARLLTLATAASFRPPGLLAKAVTTVDVLSGGRAWLGIGAGHFEEEARGLGVPLPPMKERFEVLEETLQVCLQMWSGEHGDDQPFHGKHVQLERALNWPQSLSRPHPPILVAGSGEQKTLRLVARYADACNLQPSPDIPHKLDVLRRHCEAEGRDYDAIEKTCAFAFDVGENGAKVDEMIGQLRWLAGMGIETVFGRVENIGQITPLEVMGREVIPAVADLGVAQALSGRH